MVFQGARLERRQLQRQLKQVDFNVCITTFDLAIRERNALATPNWRVRSHTSPSVCLFILLAFLVLQSFLFAFSFCSFPFFCFCSLFLVSLKLFCLLPFLMCVFSQRLYVRLSILCVCICRYLCLSVWAYLRVSTWWLTRDTA